MSSRQNGFSTIEVLVATAIIALLSSTASAVIYQTLEGTHRSNSHTTCIFQVQNAGYWITCDTQMAESVVVDNLEYPNFLVLSWAEQDYTGGDPTYHSVTYFFADLSDGIGKLKRSHWSSAGVDEQIVVAQYIYYNPADPDNTSKVSYQNPVLTLQITAIFSDADETREYRINRRPTL